MITHSETKQILESIKSALSLSTAINPPMVDAWHSVLKRHKFSIIETARDELIMNWSTRYFPMPNDLRQYISLAYNQADSDINDFSDNSTISPELSARVKKLRGTSEKNIAIRAANKDKSRVECAKCNKPALMNLKADDYCEYWKHPVTNSLKEKYFCGKHTDELNDFLRVGVGK